MTEIHDEIRARRIVIVDKGDKERIRLSISPNGVASIELSHPTDDETFLVIEAGAEVDFGEPDHPWVSIAMRQPNAYNLIGPDGEQVERYDEDPREAEYNRAVKRQLEALLPEPTDEEKDAAIAQWGDDAAVA